MNRTGPLVGVMSVLTVVIIAVLAAAALATMLWGTRQRARRRAANAELAERSEAAGIEPPVVEPTTPLTPPVAPAPPPLAGLDEPIPVVDLQSNPAATAVALAPPADAPEGGDLTRLKGLGPKVAARLGELGIGGIADLAALTPDGAEAIDAQMGSFRGRIARDRWIEQAQLLAAGDTAGFEAQFGKL